MSIFLLSRYRNIFPSNVLKSRDTALMTKVRIVKAMVFPEVMCGCESWTIKKAEHQRTDTFKLWCCRRLESPLYCNQPILKEIKPEHSLKGLMLKLKLQYSDQLIWRTNSLEKMVGKIEVMRRRGWQRSEDWIESTQWTLVWANFRRWWRTGKPSVKSMVSQRVGHDWATEQQQPPPVVVWVSLIWASA